MTRSRIGWALAVIAGWSVLAVLFTPQHYVLSRRGAGSPHWSTLLIGNLAMFWVWAALTPVIVWFGRRYLLERRRAALHLLLHFLAGFVFAFMHIALVRYVNVPLTGRSLQPWMNFIVGYGATGVLISWGIQAASQALTYFQRYQDREFRLVQAQLQSLKTQLHPHFLFNTLNAIAELMHQDTSRAERTITQLSDLLRTALNRGDSDEVSFKDELDFLRNYIEIQQTLLEERLAVRWDIADDTLDARVPGMLLQPLVENAIQHGIGPRAAGGTIAIRGHRHANTLRISVEDDGMGLGEDVRGGEGTGGIGLANTRARLRHMYADAHAFTLERGASGGVTVTIDVPFRGSDVRELAASAGA
ncbi:MAG: histidine kinase [Acidobacteriota bacterium]|nr:histidine kinase [Acidobacteriota bacterium]